MTDEQMDQEWAEAETEWYRAETEKFKAEAERAKAEAEHQRAQARQVTAMAEVEEIQLAEAREKDEVRRADDFHARVYRFTSPVGANTVEAAIAKLSTWSRIDPGCDIEIVFDSPGGSVIPGMHLYDHIQEMRRAGHRVTTVARGMAASMGGILLQAGTHRVMSREAYILIHEIQAGAIGTMGEIEDEVLFLKKIQSRILSIFAERSNLTKKQLAARWKRTNWWIDSSEALEHGLVDEVR